MTQVHRREFVQPAVFNAVAGGVGAGLVAKGAGLAPAPTILIGAGGVAAGALFGILGGAIVNNIGGGYEGAGSYENVGAAAGGIGGGVVGAGIGYWAATASSAGSPMVRVGGALLGAAALGTVAATLGGLFAGEAAEGAYPAS